MGSLSSRGGGLGVKVTGVSGLYLSVQFRHFEEQLTRLLFKSVLGHSRRFGNVRIMSAGPLSADPR